MTEPQYDLAICAMSKHCRGWWGRFDRAATGAELPEGIRPTFAVEIQ